MKKARPTKHYITNPIKLMRSGGFAVLELILLVTIVAGIAATTRVAHDVQDLRSQAMVIQEGPGGGSKPPSSGGGNTGGSKKEPCGGKCNPVQEICQNNKCVRRPSGFIPTMPPVKPTASFTPVKSCAVKKLENSECKTRIIHVAIGETCPASDNCTSPEFLPVFCSKANQDLCKTACIKTVYGGYCPGKLAPTESNSVTPQPLPPKGLDCKYIYGCNDVSNCYGVESDGSWWCYPGNYCCKKPDYMPIPRPSIIDAPPYSGCDIRPDCSENNCAGTSFCYNNTDWCCPIRPTAAPNINRDDYIHANCTPKPNCNDNLMDNPNCGSATTEEYCASTSLGEFCCPGGSKGKVPENENQLMYLPVNYYPEITKIVNPSDVPVWNEQQSIDPEARNRINEFIYGTPIPQVTKPPENIQQLSLIDRIVMFFISLF